MLVKKRNWDGGIIMLSNVDKADIIPLMKVKNLKKWFPIKRGLLSKTVGHVKAVDDVSFNIYIGETLGLVGESGCGKTTLSRTILRLLEPTSGSIEFEGNNIMSVNGMELRSIRRNMQIVFQDPFGSLHPMMKIGKIIEEPLLIGNSRNRWNKEKRYKRILELIDQVGLKEEHLNRYPHEFSGGQRQRIVIARALATSPKLIICDEPVSALDVSVRAQILNLLEELQKELKLTYLFISHDLSVVEHISDRIAVMYLGQIVELSSKEELFNNPLHPYTQALLSSIPLIDNFFKKERITLKGDIPSPANPPNGCRFHTRCRYATEGCKNEQRLTEVGDSHYVACHLHNSKEVTKRII